MLERLKSYQSLILSLLIGLFFILILHFKLSYNLIPILLTVSGLVLLFPHLKQRNWQLDNQEKWLVGTFVIYFLLFVASLMVHKGKGSELDLASRALLVLPILTVLTKKIVKHQWIIYSLLIAGLAAGSVAATQVFALNYPKPFAHMMHIQAGGIAMSVAIFIICALFHFSAQKNRLMTLISLICAALATLSGFLTTARGAWIGVPFVLIVIFWLNRQQLTKMVASSLILALFAGGLVAGNVISKRFAEAQNEIYAYVEQNNGNTSVGARFDMWESALLGIQEKPIFGWGLQGVKAMRKQHFAEKKISEFAASFDHSHNQYLHDGSARGILGILALLAVFLVPLSILLQNTKLATCGTLEHLWGVAGIAHILLVMSYCLTQSFISHTSGAMFYFVGVILFIGLQKNAKNRPLAGKQ